MGSGNIVIINAIVENNLANGSFGGGIYSSYSEISIYNSTIVHNNPSGIYRYGETDYYLTNTILWGNVSEQIDYASFNVGGDVSVNHCIVQGGQSSIETHGLGTLTWGNSNIDSNPLFIDATYGNYRLSGFSPAIGAGTSVGAPLTDINGNPRPIPTGSNPDMGAYENSQPSRRPKGGNIVDGLDSDITWINKVSELSANWSAFEDDGEVTYEYAIGKTIPEVTNQFESLKFNGLDDYVQVNTNMIHSMLNYLSISAWINPISYDNGNPRVVQKGDGGDNNWRLEISGGNLNFHVEGLGSVQAAIAPEFNQWSHVVATTGSDGQLKLYLNNQLVGSNGYGGSINETNHNLFIGCKAGQYDWFDGHIYDVRIWNADLTEENVNQLYNFGDVLPNSLVGHWMLNDGEGMVAYDDSQHGNNGVINGAQWSTNSPPYTTSLPTVLNDILDWTRNQTSTSVTSAGLSLTEGESYTMSVRATDSDGQISDTTTTNGVTIDLTLPVISGVAEGADISESSGVDNYSLSFDGDGDYVDLNYTNGQIESEISISAWVNLNNNSNGGHIIFNGFGGSDANWHWGMQLEDSDAGGGIQPKIMLHTDQGINGAGHKPSPNNGIIAPNSGWHHVAMTYGNSTLKIYLDGIEVHTETVQGGNVTESSRVNIGGWENFDETFSGSMDGKIDEISVWNKALTVVEVQNYMNTALTGNESDLVGYWNFNEGEGTTLTDQTSNGNNGTIVGATWDNDVPENSTTSTGGDADYQNSTDSLLVSWLGSDEASGIASFEYALGSQSVNDVVDWTDAGLETSRTLGSLSMSEGTQYTLSARATDVAGNLSQIVTGDGILIDLAPPYTGVVYDGIELQQLSDEAFTGSDTSLFGSWESFGDDVSGIAGYEVSVNDGSIYPWTAIGDVSTKKLDGLDLTNGNTYSFDVRALDKAGNTSATVSSNGIKVDTQAPSSSVAVVSDYYNQVLWDQSIQIQGSAVDGTNESGLASVEITIQNTSNGNYYNGDGWRTEATWLTPQGTDTWLFDLSSGELIDGNDYVITSRSTDAVGNIQTEYGQDSFTYDNSEPESSFQFAENFYGPILWDSETVIQGTSYDAFSAVGTVDVSLRDDTGGGTFFNGQDWTNSSEQWFRADGQENWSFSINSSSFEDTHQYTVFIRSTDLTGNQETTPASSYFTFDSSLPASEVLIEREFYNTNNWSDVNSISGVSGDAVSGVDSVRISILRTSDNYWCNGSSQWVINETWLEPSGLENWSYALNLNTLVNGVSYVVSSRATDITGNVQTEFGRDTLTYDVTNPNTGLVYDGLVEGTDQDWSNSTTTISANWSGFNDVTSGIELYEYSIGYTPGATNVLTWTDGGQETSFTEEVFLATGNAYYISVRATDGAGNVSNISTSNGITIDAIDPVVTDVVEGDPNEDQDYQQDGSSLIISWGGSDDLRTFRNTRELSNYNVSLGTVAGGSDVVDWDNVGSVDNYEFTGLSLQESVTYYANVKALDLAGNESSVVSGDGITIDQSGPVTGSISDGDSVDVDWVNVNFLANGNWTGFNDELSGIQEYEYSLGLSPGQTQVVTWTSAGLDDNITVSAALTEGPTYYANLRAIDSVQNVSDIISSDGFGLDQSVPVAGTVNDGPGDDMTWTNNDGSVLANWSGFSDEYSGISQYDYSVSSSPNSTSWQTVTEWISIGMSTTLDLDLDLDHGLTYRVEVRAIDLVDNVSSEVFSNGVTIDTLDPVFTYLDEAQEGDPLYQGSDSSLVLFWEGSDDLSGIVGYEVAIGTSLGDSDLVTWTDVGMDMTTDLIGLALVDGSTYYGSVRTMDLAGNTAEFNGNGVIVDTTPPESGIVLDGLAADNEYQSTTGIEVSWSGFSDQGSGISEYVYSLGTEEDPMSILDHVSSGLMQSMTLTGLALDHGSRYVFSVEAIDTVGNVSEAVMSNGFIVDEYVGPPQITGLSLDTLNSLIALTSSTDLVISLSEPLQSFEIGLQAGVESGYGVSEVYTEDPPQLVVTFKEPFASYDSLTLSMTNVVDIAGIQGDDRELRFATALLGDYDLDMTVNVSDLAAFISAWNSDDHSLELGPTTGEVPNLVPIANGVLDLRDIMAFTRMWHWSHQTGGAALLAYDPIGTDVDITQSGSKLTLDLPQDAIAANVQIIYPKGQETLALDNDFDPERLVQLSYHEAESGMLTIDRAFMHKDLGKNMSFVVNSMDRDGIQIEVNYEVYGEDSRLIMSGRKTVDVVSVPDEFALHQNYPNPFNPVTQIDYDIPKDGLTRMVIYDVMGREVKELIDQSLTAGYHTIRWDGTNSRGMNVSAGLYFCSLSTGSFNKTMKLLLLK